MTKKRLTKRNREALKLLKSLRGIGPDKQYAYTDGVNVKQREVTPLPIRVHHEAFLQGPISSGDREMPYRGLKTKLKTRGVRRGKPETYKWTWK